MQVILYLNALIPDLKNRGFLLLLLIGAII